MREVKAQKTRAQGKKRITLLQNVQMDAKNTTFIVEPGYTVCSLRLCKPQIRPSLLWRMLRPVLTRVENVPHQVLMTCLLTDVAPGGEGDGGSVADNWSAQAVFFHDVLNRQLNLNKHSVIT